MAAHFGVQIMSAIQSGKLIEVEEGYIDVNENRPTFPAKSQQHDQTIIRHGTALLYIM